MNLQVATLEIIKHPKTAPATDHLLAISEHKKSGLILCKEFHAEFAGPGAAVNCLAETTYRAVIAIGSPELTPVLTPEDRRRAFGRRIQWGRWLQRILEHPEPLMRAEKLLMGFEEFFGRQAVIGLPAEVFALLAGVLPGTIEVVRTQHWRSSRLNAPSFLPGADQIKVTTIPRTLRHEIQEVPLLTTATVREIEQTYAVLRSA